jgi:hypothetical protein
MGGKFKKYLSYSEASKIVKEMKIMSYRDYVSRYKEYPGLPKFPREVYGDEYFDWEDFSGVDRCYRTFEEARDAVIRLGIRNLSEYRERYKEDPKLPSVPSRVYAGAYETRAFYGRTKQYLTMTEASEAVVRIGFRTRLDYLARRHLDPMLPAVPSVLYSDEWKGWGFFLKVDNSQIKGKGKYQTYQEFTSAVRKLGIISIKEYRARYREDPKLPSAADVFYKKDWNGWLAAFGVSRRPKSSRTYATWQEAKSAIAQYRFSSSIEYKNGCWVDERLYKYPPNKYKDFPGWDIFLLPDNYSCLDDVRCAVKILNIKNSVDYKDVRKIYPSLPAHPERMFASEWVDWYELCNMARTYSYEKLQEIVISNACTTIKDYRELMTKLRDPGMPSSPEEVYPQWKNWHVFLNKPEPYALAYIQGCGVGWIPSIQQFLKNQRSRQSKETNICRFIRHFIEPNDLGKTPREFLTRKGTDIKPFKVLMESQVSSNVGRSLRLAVNGYLNEVLRRDLTIEDEETGELIRVEGANNPFSALEYKGSGASGSSESTKPALAFQYVDTMKKWMVAESAKNFSDLAGLLQFDADYFEVDGELIDRSDPDCVFKMQGDKYFLWYPGYWMLAYVLVSVPARGRQIAYNDSGEFDEYIADIEDGKVVWIKNKNPLAQRKLHQAFIQRCDDNAWGMHFTSNKTSFIGQGYDVPWAPERMIYWMIKLRKWQEKYNPIKRAMPWLECTRTNLNEAQLKQKGTNCFLFRSFKEEEPPSFTPRLAERLAAALYFSQPRNLALATFTGGNRNALYRYESKYTPHSMRVSLITAYVMEFGLPIEIIMKLAGHASVVMSIYYVKVGAAVLRRRMDEGEKLALRDQAYAAQEMLEQNRIDELTHTMVANSEQALQVLRAGNAGSTLVRDYGLCPYAAARCEDGGPAVGATQVWYAVPAGYLGMQNCIRCRHFITGPMFLGGLLSLWNEISLSLNFLSEHYFDFEKEIDKCVEKIRVLDEIEYDLEQVGGSFDSSDRNRIEREMGKLQSEKESVAKKMDMFLCDMQMLTKQVNECKTLITEQASKSDGQVQLIVHGQNEIKVEIEQTSLFQQLSEVCINASIFQSATADFATPRRSQMIDRMALFNKVRPVMCSLNEKEQLAVGNQVTKFLLQRLKTWNRVDQLIDGRVLLEELGDDEKISKEEFGELLASKAPQLLNLKEVFV